MTRAPEPMAEAMRAARAQAPAPERVAAEPGESRLQLPDGPWSTLLEGLSARFPNIPRSEWQSRFARSAVRDADGRALAADAPYVAGRTVRYRREVANETVIPFEERILHVDEDLVVVDKPHFLPVAPTGDWVEQTLLRRLMRRLDNPQLVPLHRLDRLTAGLVLFSARPASRAAYHALFRARAIDKTYTARAHALPGLPFPQLRESHIEVGEPFFRRREGAGPANSRSEIDVQRREGEIWQYRLRPQTGRTHQLRLHMAALGAPILNDPLYPTLREPLVDDYARPLQLLAETLAFTDPLSGRPRRFETGLQLGG